MKKIGYIYTYHPFEKKGILVYGKWMETIDDGFRKNTHFKNEPIIFQDRFCLSEVCKGQLVYFNLDEEGNAFDIERASLDNFDVEFFEKLIEADNEWQYENNTIISYEDINKKGDSDCNNPNCIEDLIKSFGIVRERVITRPGRSKRIVQRWNDSVNLNIIDLSLWVDNNKISKQKYFGENVEDIRFLYNVFVLNMRKDLNGNIVFPKKRDDSISIDAWKILLEKFSNEELKEIIKFAPLLQPALPIEFCKENLVVLDDKYGMPTKDLCKDYCAYKVNNSSTASDYKEWSQKLYVFANCNANHLPDEGVPMCSIGKEYIIELEKILEKNYIDHIKINIINSLINLLGTDSFNSDNELSKTELLDIGVFLDILDTFNTFSSHYNAARWSHRFEKIVESYNSLEKQLRALLLEAWTNFVNESLSEFSLKKDIDPLFLGSTVDLVKDYITDNTKSIIVSIVNDKFSKAINFSDLTYAFENGYVLEKQFLEALIKLTDNFTTTQFARFITNSSSDIGSLRFEELPLDTQKYILCRIVEVYGAKELNKGEAVRISDFNGFCNLENFIRWLTELKSGQYGEINHKAIELAILKAIEPLNEQEIKYLFDKKYLVKPGDTIETILSQYCDQLARDMEYQNYRDSLCDDDSYGQYSGFWAQDVEGYSDDDIDTIFDSDPDAYWNID